MRNELLVIEDAAVHVSILRKIAAQAGFNTTDVSSVDAASIVLQKRSLDCTMPELSLGKRPGTEVLELNIDPPFSKPIDLMRPRQTLKQIAQETDRRRLVRAAGW
ncbi:MULTISPECIES: response regulator [unclassified Bradyrhizobium]|uniref:response regulator n=1 Tax=unclassified Bradyrhizobium TaxID=2631580 RepID=UPI0029166FD6|nr:MULTISPECIES: response regulator [unclassified Bradyrhizobium]